MMKGVSNMKRTIVKSIYAVTILLFVSLSALFAKAIINDAYASSNIAMDEQLTPSCTPEPEPTEEIYQVILNAEGITEDTDGISNMSVEEKPTSSQPTDTISPSATPTNTPQPTEQPTNTPKPTATTKPTNTPKPTEKATNTPKPTATPTVAPDYIIMSDKTFRNDALRGVNEARETQAESNPEIEPVVLDSGLNEMAEAHAIQMALKDETSFHSNYGIVESVSSGAWIGGYWEGIAAAGHATQLCMDEDITRIGVGCAKSSTGRIFTCILGGRD